MSCHERLDEEAIFDAARRIDDRPRNGALHRHACGGDDATRSGVSPHLRSLGAIANSSAASARNRNLYHREPAIAERPGDGDRPLQAAGADRRRRLRRRLHGRADSEPVRRKVALKIIKPGMDTRAGHRPLRGRAAGAGADGPSQHRPGARRRRDRLRPAVLRHGTGQGVPITEYCDQNHLTPRERLELFIPVCQAVQHAHQKGIIHRDLKPSNVLVTVARRQAGAQGDRLRRGQGDRPAADRARRCSPSFAQMIGTPLYMSPEQAELSGLDIDTRSDIYSLGVLLYELLTGTTPFDKERFAKAALRRDPPDHPRGGAAEAEHAARARRVHGVDRCPATHGAGEAVASSCAASWTGS